eukprot:Skav216606  [mRNA]  locus=scaffold4297:8074:21883:+ [translate_table: standard]
MHFQGPFTVYFTLVDVPSAGIWYCRADDHSSFWLVVDGPRSQQGHTGSPYTLVLAPCVAHLGNLPVYHCPEQGVTTLVRRHSPQDPPRVLELCAGLGGWTQAIQGGFKNPPPVLSVEVSPSPARAFAATWNKRLFTPHELISGPFTDGIVLADLWDSSWWPNSLSSPFSHCVFSAPCQPWSSGGLKRGLDSADGLLLIKVILLLKIFGVGHAAGENVPGLANHAHWPRVQKVCATLAFNVHLVHHDLASIGIMTRARSFMMFNPVQEVQRFPPFHCEWAPLDHCVVHPPDLLGDQVPPEDVAVLSQRKFLPSNLRFTADLEGRYSPKEILSLGVHRGPKLPTFVASYTRQTSLDSRHLAKRGAFTWLIPDNSVCGGRYLDCLEAVRALGFRLHLVLPSDQQEAMQCLGNSLAPPQALMMVLAIGGDMCVSFTEANQLALFWLHGQLPVSRLCKVFCGELMHAGLIATRPSHPLTLGHVPVLCGGKFFPTLDCITLGGSNSKVLHLLPLGDPWRPVEVARIFQEDDLTLLVRTLPVFLDFQLESHVLRCPVTPLASMHNLCQIFKPAGICACLVDSPLWTWVDSEVITLQASHFDPIVQGQAFFTHGSSVCTWNCDGSSLLVVLSALFPLLDPSHSLVTDSGNRALDLNEEVRPAQAYWVEYRPVRFWIEPHGPHLLDPLMTIAEVEKLLLFKWQHGRGSVHILANGATLVADTSLVEANHLGPLRARYFGLIGGAWTLSGISEAIQNILVQHGCPATSAKARSDLLYEKLGHVPMKKILDDKNPWQALKQQATAKGIEIIPHSGGAQSSSSDPFQDNDPWKTFQPTGTKVPVRNPRQRERRKKSTAQVDTRLDLSFFHGKGQPLSAVDIRDLFQGIQGICVTKLADIQDHIAAVCATQHTLEPSAVVLLGDETAALPKSIEDRISVVTAPGWLGTHPTAFRVTLIQTGDDPVELHATGQLEVVESLQTHKVFSFHVYRAECERWETLVAQGIIGFLRDLGYKAISAISQTWSIAWYNRGKKAEPQTAEYHFGYLKVELAHIDALMRLGGVSGFYPSPRASTKGPDETYRSLLLRGYSLAEARTVQVQHAVSLGLTKTRQGYGVRVLADHYDRIKNQVFPNAIASSDSEQGGPRKFQLVGTPPEANRSLVKQALKALDWPAKVLRSSGVAPATAPAAASTKLAQVEEQANTKIHALESRLDALTEQVEKQHQVTDGRLQGLQTGLGLVQQQVDSQSAQVDAKLTTMFEKLLKSQSEGIARIELSNRKTVDGLRDEYQAGYKELKNILSHSPKAGRVDGSTASVEALQVGSTLNWTLSDAGVDYGSVLNVTFESCAYRVLGAGREEVNGCYTKTQREENGAPVYANRNGIILFKYIMRRGTPYWYFTQDGHPADDSKGDYYRVQSAADCPPADGWNTKSCPRGEGTCCPEVRAMDSN